MILKRKYILIYGICFLVILTTPIFFFVYNFRSYEISNETIHWGVFGDFIGGILNPIISLANLLILGYLTYLVSKQSNIENKKLFLLQQKMLAYQDLVKNFKEINLLPKRMSQFKSKFNVSEAIPINKRGEFFIQETFKLNEMLNVFSDFYYTLKTFDLRYGHLFEYDFDKSAFKNLLREAKNMNDTFDKFQFGLTENDNNFQDLDIDTNFFNKKYLKYLEDFINEIRSELY